MHLLKNNRGKDTQIKKNKNKVTWLKIKKKSTQVYTSTKFFIPHVFFTAQSIIENTDKIKNGRVLKLYGK